MADPIPAPVAAEPAWYIDAGGSVRPVSADQIGEANALGWEPASPERVKEFQLQQKYGDTIGQLEAGTAAAARALTFGGSDVLLTKSGLVDPETLRGLEEANPVSSGVGTGVGIALPLLLTGGAAAPAEAAAGAAEAGALGAAKVAAKYAAPSIIARAGQATTRAIEGALPKAEGLLGRMVQRAVASGVGSAVEGAAYGSGQVVSEAALGDPNLTAQSALAEIGAMTALGGGLGAALGIAHEAVPAAVAKARDAVGSLFGKAKGAVEDWYAGASSLHGRSPATMELAITHKLEIDELNRVAPGISDTILNAQPATAQTIIANGAGIGALEREFPGVWKSLSKTRPDTLALIAQNQPVFANLEREFPGTIRSLSAAEPGTAQFLADNWTQIVRDPAKRAKIIESVRKSGNEILDSTDKMFKQAYRSLGGADAEVLLADANPAAIIDSYSQFWAKAADAIGKMESRPSLFDQYYPAKLKTILEDVMLDSGKAADPVTAFKHLTRLRQAIDDTISWSKPLASKAAEDADRVMRDLYFDVSRSLKNPEVFGQAGAQKGALDEAFSRWKRITERVPGAQLGKSQRGTSNFNFLLMQSGELAPTKMATWFRYIHDDRGALKTVAWSDMLDAARNAVDAVEKLHEVAPVKTFDRAAVRDLLSKTSSLAEDAKLKFAASNTLDQLNPKLARSIVGGLADATAGQAAQQAVGAAHAATAVLGHGPIVSTVKAVLSPIGTAVDTATNPSRAIHVLASLERIGKRVSTAIDSASSTLVRGGARAENVGRAEALAGIAREFSSSAEDATRRFSRRVADIQRLSQDPESLHRALVAQNDGIDEHAPQTSQALSIASARAVAFLQSKMPQDPQRGPLAPKWEPSQSEIARFSRYYEAVNDPLVILKQASAGTLTPEAVEAVRAVYPELMARIQSGLIEKLASHSGTPPHRSRLMLSMLLGVDTDGSIKALAANQATHRGPTNKQQGGAAPAPKAINPSSEALGRITLSNRSLTAMQATADRRH